MEQLPLYTACRSDKSTLPSFVDDKDEGYKRRGKSKTITLERLLTILLLSPPLVVVVLYRPRRSFYTAFSFVVPSLAKAQPKT